MLDAPNGSDGRLHPNRVLAALRQAVAELRDAAQTDTLTGVHNRRHFDERFIAESRRAQRTRAPLAKCRFS